MFLNLLIRHNDIYLLLFNIPAVFLLPMSFHLTGLSKTVLMAWSVIHLSVIIYIEDYVLLYNWLRKLLT